MKTLLIALLTVPVLGFAATKDNVTRSATKSELVEIHKSLKNVIKSNKRLEGLVSKLTDENTALKKQNKALKDHVIVAVRKRTSIIIMSAVVGLILGCVAMGLIKR